MRTSSITNATSIRRHLLSVEDVTAHRDIKHTLFTSSRPIFWRLYDITLDVQMTKLFASKWPNFWCPNDQIFNVDDQTFDVQMTKLLTSKCPYYSYAFILHLTTEQRLIILFVQLPLPPPLVLHKHHDRPPVISNPTPPPTDLNRLVRLRPVLYQLGKGDLTWPRRTGHVLTSKVS